MFSSAFALGNVGMRKPDLCFFEHVIDKIGFHRHITLKDNFAQLLIWELNGDADIIYFKWPSGKLHPAQSSGNSYGNMEASVKGNVKNGLWNYFYEDLILTTQEFPADVDTTLTAYLSLPQSCLSEVADVHLILDKMAFNMSPDGIMQTYFCDDRPRTAPEVRSNMLRLFYRFGPRIRKTADWVVQCLNNRAYLYGNRVYSTPETLLYFTAWLYLECGEGTLKKNLEPIKEALLERINVPYKPISPRAAHLVLQFGWT